MLRIVSVFACIVTSCTASDRSGDGSDTPDAGPADAGFADPVTGRACSVASDCGTGYACSTEAPGGYCLPGSPGGPTACREPETPCPVGTVCSPLPLHAISGVCLRPCEQWTECRPGYVCDFLALFPDDPQSPKSPRKVCWHAVCQPGADQTCNDSPYISSIHGTCQPDGTCTCSGTFEKNPATGRCR